MKIQIKRAVSLICLLAALYALVPMAAFATESMETAAMEETAEVTEAAEPIEEDAVPEHIYEIDTESGVYASCQSAAEGMQARQILVYDATEDEILYAKTVEGSKLYPASTTKLFSIYVALQHLEADTVVTAGDELDMLDEGSSIAYITQGHQLTVEMLAEGMLLPSGNDAALVLAAAAGKAVAGDDSLSGAEAVQVFVEEMNRVAGELGFEKSQFTNPHGFHMGAHYTCVSDMARIARLALENPVISKYMKVFEADVVYASGHSNHWINTNRLLDPESEFYYPGTLGMKTGRTSQAGYCLMSAFKLKGHTIVIGVFGYDNADARFRDVISLLNACNV